MALGSFSITGKVPLLDSALTWDGYTRIPAKIVCNGVGLTNRRDAEQ
jgi:hypothetical protein